MKTVHLCKARGDDGCALREAVRAVLPIGADVQVEDTGAARDMSSWGLSAEEESAAWDALDSA